MRRILTIVIVLLSSLIVLGLGLTWFSKSRDARNHLTCRNHLRILALLGTPYEIKDDMLRVDAKAPVPMNVWPGTVFNAALRPEERLSWVVLALPTWAKGSTLTLDRNLGWNQPPNREAARQVLRVLICPAAEQKLTDDEPAPTMYVGIAGVGRDAAELPLSAPLSPDAGAFRYDSATPLELIARHDGLSRTLLFGQTTRNLGPWIRGGPSTVRGITDDVPILAWRGGQFGGAFADGAHFAFCDGSVRFFRYGTDEAILRSLATIAGGPLNID